MESTQENGSDCNMNTKTSNPWSSKTNWVIAHGCLEASVVVESSDYPIAEADPETASRKSPLVLKPPTPDSGPCEMKICFDRKYDVGQIYVRSTARVYEVYYAHSLQSSNEYLCTVKCGVAERDEELLQTSCIEDAVEEYSECLSEEITEETIADGENIVPSEDEWVKIKLPEVGTSSVLPHKNKHTNNTNNTNKDLYEATAQISDADPCSVLTIRLLSLQDKDLLYIDELYVFANPIESIDLRNEKVLAGNSSESSLMAMFVPALLQLSKSSVRQVDNKCAYDEVLNNNKMENGSRSTDVADVGLETNKVNEQYAKPKELDKDILKETVNRKDSQQGHLERALEQLMSRMSRVEDICLRFEEKLLKPIESIEARLQRVEHQLQKLADNSNYFGFPHCTRISAPTFSCSESNSSSFHNEQSDFTACDASELGKKDSFSCNNTPELSNGAKFHPSLIVSAPEFPCDDNEENRDDLELPKDSEQKKKLSCDDALAAALNLFLSTAMIHPSDSTQATSESCQIKIQECLFSENVSRESLRHGKGLTCRPPKITKEEIGNEEHSNYYTRKSLDMASESKNDKQDDRDLCENLNTYDFESATHVDFSAAFEANTIECYFEMDNNLNSVETSIDSRPDHEEDSVKNEINDVYDETNQEKRKSFQRDDHDDDAMTARHVSKTVLLDRYGAEEKCFKDNTINVSNSSCASVLDFEFPILEVEFNSDVASATTKSPLEALLDGTAESNTEQINDVILDEGTMGLSPVNDLLIDTGVSVVDGWSNFEGGPDNTCTPNGSEMNVSLI
ncbi:hypothetical protein OROHE_004711 [Orobanche hederae]